MTSNEKMYQHSGIVRDVTLTGRIEPTDSPAEGHVGLEVKQNGSSIRLECFILTEVADMFHDKEITIGDVVLTEFWLLADYTSPIKLQSKEKRLVWVERPHLLHPAYTSEQYLVKGKGVESRPHPRMHYSNLAILDCGLYVFTRVAKTVPLRIGDYLQMDGRLDAHIVGKVN